MATASNTPVIREGFAPLTSQQEESMTQQRIGCTLAATAIATLFASAAAAQTTTIDPPGRLVASNCFQCHGTNGKGGFETLAGESASEIYNELREFRTKTEGGIMEPHARGYSDAQLRLMADYFSKQR
jgi:cytochrome subunit of sulfide dehydrogenase